MIALEEIAAFLDACFAGERYGEDTNGVYRPSARPVRRLGLALEPWPAIETWVETHQLDALFLHRPWNLTENGDIGVLAYHLPFDEHLTLGYNPRLADALLMSEREVLGEKEGRPLGMLGSVTPRSFSDALAVLDAVFGGHEDVIAPASSFPITRVALMGAMTDALVRESHERGAQLYVTGQMRQPVRLATQETGVGVVAVGHRRSELWGLRALVGLLRERWASLEIIL